MEKTQYITVILPLKLEWEPYYRATIQTKVGDRVKVKFTNREYIGVVSQTEVTPQINSEKINDILSVEEDMEKIRLEEIELWKNVAKYYLCSIGEVYKVAYPSGKINMEQSRAEARRKVCDRRAKVLAQIENRLSNLELRLNKKIEHESKAKEGSKIKSSLGDDIIKIKEEIRAGKQARETAENALRSAEAGMLLNPGNKIEDKVILSEPQQKAYNSIVEDFRIGKPVLLHGVTGSGKTEIYIKLAHKCISEKKNVLYMVPEIALSRQLEERLYEHFGENLIVFHSGESTAARRNAAEMIRHIDSETANYIVLCTRSGIFLPHHNLGLIIVDEEHDTSFKQDSPAPRYNGRDTALMLWQIQGKCKIILGSATPSLESLYNVSVGKYSKVTLNEKYHSNCEADIEIIDTKAEWKKNGMVGNFSRKLIDNMNATLEKGEQILILRSRRAWSSALQCEACGEIQKCPHCNVSLSYHKPNNEIRCHYCGYKAQFTGKCSKCSGDLKHLGSGTQKIEEETTKLFPYARIARLDSDTKQQKSYEAKTIKKFADREIDIMIGTQIITKGFDFNNLSLVVIIAADTLLSIQDFRADEKAMQVIEQFKGRCGRRSKPGKLIIQTSQPEHPVYKQISEKIDTSVKCLMMERKEFDFPPYSRIIELTIKDISEDRVERMAIRLTDQINMISGVRTSNIIITGPYSPSVDKLQDQHIRKIRISLKKNKTLTENKMAIKEVICNFEKVNRYNEHISIDVDPA